eukprot:scaffold277_cov261-Pinguiococcus_pyrenoidosus.AAC.9
MAAFDLVVADTLPTVVRRWRPIQGDTVIVHDLYQVLGYIGRCLAALQRGPTGAPEQRADRRSHQVW